MASVRAGRVPEGVEQCFPKLHASHSLFASSVVMD